MYEFYKTMNKFLYELGKLLFVGGILAFFGGLIYFFIMPLFYSQYEISNKLTDFTLLSYIAYCAISIYTGLTVTNRYNKIV